MATNQNTLINQVNNLSAKFEQSYQQLSDKYIALADSAGASSATLQTNNINTQAAISEAQDVTTSATKTKNLAIGALLIVAVIGLIFFLRK